LYLVRRQGNNIPPVQTPKIPPTTPPTRLWLLPLIAGLLPAVAAVAAFRISVTQEIFAPCNPFIDGCVSISRAGRYGVANHVFRALMVPAAILQAITWLLCTSWLLRLGAAGRSLNWLPWLGLAAGIFLVVYGTFIGTEGNVYQLLRRYGVMIYFGCTYLCMLVTANLVHQLVKAGAVKLPARVDVALLALLAANLLMGLTQVFAAPFLLDAEARDRVEDTVEWYAGASFTVFFCALAWLWKRTTFRTSFHTRSF
jgi:hypothetical protein